MFTNNHFYIISLFFTLSIYPLQAAQYAKQELVSSNNHQQKQVENRSFKSNTAQNAVVTDSRAQKELSNHDQEIQLQGTSNLSPVENKSKEVHIPIGQEDFSKTQRLQGTSDLENFGVLLDENIYNYFVRRLFFDQERLTIDEKIKLYFYTALGFAIQVGGLIYTSFTYTTTYLVSDFREDLTKVSCDSGFDDSCQILFRPDSANKTLIPAIFGYAMGWAYLQKTLKEATLLPVVAGDTILKEGDTRLSKFKKCSALLTVMLIQGFVFYTTSLNMYRITNSAISPIDSMNAGIAFIILNEIDNCLYDTVKDFNQSYNPFLYKLDKSKMEKLIFRGKKGMDRHNVLCSMLFLSSMFSKMIYYKFFWAKGIKPKFDFNQLIENLFLLSTLLPGFLHIVFCLCRVKRR